MAVTISAVAKEAGVAIGTVSRAFNGYDDILPSTRQRIFEAAEKLGYTPNASARSLSSKRPPNLGFIGSGILEGDDLDTNFPRLLRGILKYCTQHDLDLSLYATDSAEQRKHSFTKFCSQHSLSGVIVSGIKTNDPYMEKLLASGTPVVTVDVPVSGENKGWISIDNVAAAKDAVNTLFSLGKKDLLIIAGKEEAAVNAQRMLGVREAFAQQGYELPDDRILLGNFVSEDAGIALKNWLQTHGTHRPDAIFCFSDIMAIGALNALHASALSVPGDISLMGFDDIPLAEIMSPSLSSVRQDMRALGYEAASLLHQIVRGETSGGHTVLPHKVVLRQSVR